MSGKLGMEETTDQFASAQRAAGERSRSFVTPRTFAFLRELAAHNERAWFEAN